MADRVGGELDERGDERLVAGAGRQHERLLHAADDRAAVISGSSGVTSPASTPSRSSPANSSRHAPLLASRSASMAGSTGSAISA